MPLLRNKGHKKSGVPFLPAWGVKKRRHGRYMKLSCLGVICVLPSLGVWLSRCCAYQGSFLKSSKSVVNSLSISAKVPVFQGFSEIIKVVFIKVDRLPPWCSLSTYHGQRRQNRSPRQVFDSVFASKTNPTVMLSSKMCIYF